MNAKSVLCPSCGQAAAGKFCGHCGASLTGLVARTPWSAQTIVPWAALGVATLALVVALLAWFDRGGAVQPAPVRFSQSSSAPLSAPGELPDLASMSPREAADRLFNRVMTASENGNNTEALQFSPMALQAYINLGTLDNDARYHVALLHLAADDSKGARVQVDLLRKSVPKHLLGYMLEHQIAERSGNSDNVARAFKAFLAAYDSEIAMGRGEYQDHMKTIERFHKAAQASVARTK